MNRFGETVKKYVWAKLDTLLPRAFVILSLYHGYDKKDAFQSMNNVQNWEDANVSGQQYTYLIKFTTMQVLLL